MKAEITNFRNEIGHDHHGNPAPVVHVFFKDCLTGKSHHSYLVKTYKNWPAWEKVLRIGEVLDGLWLKKNGLIDADSNFKKVAEVLETTIKINNKINGDYISNYIEERRQRLAEVRGKYGN